MRLDKIIARSRIIDLRSLDAGGRARRAPRRLHRAVPRPEAGRHPEGPARPREHDDDLPRARRGASPRAGEDLPPLHPRHRPQPRRHAPPGRDVGRAGAPDRDADRGRVGPRHPPGARVDRQARARAGAGRQLRRTRRTSTRSTSGCWAGSAGCGPSRRSRTASTGSCSAQAEHVAKGAGCSATDGLRRHLHRGHRAGHPPPEDQDDPRHPQPDRGRARSEEEVRRHDPGAVLLEPAAGPAAERAPGRAHPRRHLVQGQDLLHRRDHREQPVRHDRRRRDRARVPDAALRARPRTCCPRT